MLKETCVDSVAERHVEQRIAVGRRVDDGIGGDIAAGARAVVDDDILPEPLRQRLLQDARDDIGRQTGCETDDQVQRPGGIIERKSELWT